MKTKFSFDPRVLPAFMVANLLMTSAFFPKTPFALSQSDQIKSEVSRSPHCQGLAEFIGEELATLGGIANQLIWKFKMESVKSEFGGKECPAPGKEFTVYVPQGEVNPHFLPKIQAMYPDFLKVPEPGERGIVRVRRIKFSGGKFKTSFWSYAWLDATNNFESTRK